MHIGNKRSKFGTIALAVGMAGSGLATQTTAADLGGDCCADLEERVAELEATTARKGNRKVSLTITGWVAEQVMWWDDGSESNVYVTGVGTSNATRFFIKGSAKIRPGLSAGYLIHVEADTADPLYGLSQDDDDAAFGVVMKKSFWFIDSKRLGKVSMGQLSPASDNTAMFVDASGTFVPANWAMYDNNFFYLNSDGVRAGGLRWADISHCNTRGATNRIGFAGDCGGGGGAGNYVRYDSPTFAGFSVSADWGEDDAWDVAARYAGEFNGVKVAAAASYYVNNEYRGVHFDQVSYFQIGAYIQHVPTGLFAYGAYGHLESDYLPTAPANLVDSADNWYVKAGVRRKWMPLGHTVLFGEYGERNDGIDQTAFINAQGSYATDSNVKQWGLGVLQEIDAAAMSMWLVYRNYEGDATLAPTQAAAARNIDFDDMHIVKFGGLIKF